ncbi:hypothetical protein OOK60_17075 [Trichothermofontia sichuanensis B231]|uniref:hypothetical protein n=1 Tax=Trichothermofontia sichuanensis TaxID=3045816 RepID=UPI0022466BD4|nr:hypothetical protein OOK60_17075 [Trichothermofontia sichuanensis B231]
MIDWETPDRRRSTSEGQAYARLRAVWMDDPDTFARTLQWGEDNRRRRQPSASTRRICPNPIGVSSTPGVGFAVGESVVALSALARLGPLALQLDGTGE